MPSRVDAAVVRAVTRAIARRATGPATLYLVGGATAVTVGWRETTIDIDLRLEPEDEGAMRAIPEIKRELGVNLELASPIDFLPELPGWRDRSPFVEQLDGLIVRQLDPYAQALAKLERGFVQDLADVDALVDRGLVEPTELARLLVAVEDQLYRFPSVDPVSLRAKVEALAARDAG
jgi:hypothetical protein